MQNQQEEEYQEYQDIPFIEEEAGLFHSIKQMTLFNEDYNEIIMKLLKEEKIEYKEREIVL